jgi:hypothetical protein
MAHTRTARKSPSYCEATPTPITGMVSPTYANTKYVDTTRPRISAGASRLAVDRLPMKTAPTATPPTIVPVRNRASDAWDSRATMMASAAMKTVSPKKITARVGKRASSSWVAAAVPKRAKHHRATGRVAVLVQHVAEEARGQRGERAKQGKRGETRNAGGDELAPPGSRYAQAGESRAQLLPVADGLGNEDQADGCDCQHGQVDLEHQHCRVGAELGEQPGNQRAEAEPAHVCRRGDHRRVPRRWATVEVGEGRRGRAGHQACRDPGQHPSDEQPADGGRHDEHDGADRAEGERREQHGPLLVAASLV